MRSEDCYPCVGNTTAESLQTQQCSISLQGVPLWGMLLRLLVAPFFRASGEIDPQPLAYVKISPGWFFLNRSMRASILSWVSFGGTCSIQLTC